MLDTGQFERKAAIAWIGDPGRERRTETHCQGCRVSLRDWGIRRQYCFALPRSIEVIPFARPIYDVVRQLLAKLVTVDAPGHVALFVGCLGDARRKELGEFGNVLADVAGCVKFELFHVRAVLLLWLKVGRF